MGELHSLSCTLTKKQKNVNACNGNSTDAEKVLNKLQQMLDLNTSYVSIQCIHPAFL